MLQTCGSALISPGATTPRGRTATPTFWTRIGSRRSLWSTALTRSGRVLSPSLSLVLNPLGGHAVVAMLDADVVAGPGLQVVHLSALLSAIGEREVSKALMVNNIGTQNILELARFVYPWHTRAHCRPDALTARIHCPPAASTTSASFARRRLERLVPRHLQTTPPTSRSCAPPRSTG